MLAPISRFQSVPHCFLKVVVCAKESDFHALQSLVALCGSFYAARVGFEEVIEVGVSSGSATTAYKFELTPSTASL